MAKELNLSADQQKKMETFYKDFGDKMKELRDNSTLTKEDRLSKMKELREQHMAEVNKILTPEQQTKMKEIQEKRGDRNMRKPDMRPQPKDKMKDFNLTEEQKEKIKVLNEDFRAKSKELTDKHREALNQVYTPEQQEKLKELRKDAPKDRRFNYSGKKRGISNYLDEASKNKLKVLKENFEKEKKAVKLSRIAPEVQKQKIKDLREKFVKEKKQIINDAKKAKENKPS